jgi:hypothetical protein
MVLAVMTAALVFAAFPVTSAYAQGENPPKGELTDQKLEKIWARELKAYERLGRAFDNADSAISRFQARLDQASKNGRDVTALQTALDAFESALNKSKPTYDSMSSLVSAHQGFDANGKVIDAEQAKSTVKEVGAKLKEIKSSMSGTFKALRKAMQDFREVNRPAGAPAERDS